MNAQTQKGTFNALRLSKLPVGETIYLRPDYDEGRRNFAVWDVVNKKVIKMGETVNLPSTGMTEVSPYMKIAEADKSKFRRMDSYTRKGLVLPKNENLYVTNITASVEQRIMQMWPSLPADSKKSMFIKIDKVGSGNRIKYEVNLSQGPDTTSNPQTNSPGITVDLDIGDIPGTMQMDENETAYINALKQQPSFTSEQRLLVLTNKANISLERAQELLSFHFPG